MYEVGSSKANTGLYNTGKGGAQVFDTSVIERAVVRKEDKVAAKKVAKAKSDADEKAKALALVSRKVGKVRPADVDHFKGATEGFRKKTMDLYSNGHTPSIAELGELEREWATISSNARASEVLWGEEQKEIGKVFAANSEFGDRSRARVNERISKSSFGKDGVFNPNTVGGEVPRYKIEAVVQKLAAARFKAVNENEVLGRRDWSEDQATADAIGLSKNPKVVREVQERLEDAYDKGTVEQYITDIYTSETDKFGNANPSYDPNGVPDGVTWDNIKIEDVLAYEYKNEFMVKGRDPLPSNYTGGGGKTKYDPKGTITTIDPATGEMNTTTGGINEKPLLSRRNYRGDVVEGAPPSRINFDPKTGVLLGAEMVTGPTDDQKRKNAIARKKNTENEDDFQNYMTANGLNEPVPVPKEEWTFLGDDKWGDLKPDMKQYKKDIDAQKKLIAEGRAKFPITEVKDQENIVPLTPKEAIRLYSQTWDINIYDAYRSKMNPHGGPAVINDRHQQAVDKAAKAGKGAVSVSVEEGYGKRVDGTNKGPGYFGELDMTDESGNVATEISIGVNIGGKEVEIPTLVPTLSSPEKAWLLGGGDPKDRSAIAESIVKKSVAHAKKRISDGDSPFKYIDYSNVEEAGIARVMKAKKWTRGHAIKALQAATKIR